VSLGRNKPPRRPQPAFVDDGKIDAEDKSASCNGVLSLNVKLVACEKQSESGRVVGIFRDQVMDAVRIH
jgi:hypothetical protein